MQWMIVSNRVAEKVHTHAVHSIRFGREKTSQQQQQPKKKCRWRRNKNKSTGTISSPLRWTNSSNFLNTFGAFAALAHRRYTLILLSFVYFRSPIHLTKLNRLSVSVVTWLFAWSPQTPHTYCIHQLTLSPSFPSSSHSRVLAWRLALNLRVFYIFILFADGIVLAAVTVPRFTTNMCSQHNPERERAPHTFMHNSPNCFRQQIFSKISPPVVCALVFYSPIHSLHTHTHSLSACFPSMEMCWILIFRFGNWKLKIKCESMWISIVRTPCALEKYQFRHRMWWKRKKVTKRGARSINPCGENSNMCSVLW